MKPSLTCSLFACIETNLMHYLSPVYSATIHLHVSGLLVTQRQEVTMYICNKWYVWYVLVYCQLAWHSTKTYNTYHLLHIYMYSSVTMNFFSVGGGGGVQQIQFRTEGRENGDLGAVAPSQGFRSICKWVKPIFLLGCYGCIFHGTGNSVWLCQNFGISRGVWTPQPHSIRHCIYTLLSPDVWLLASPKHVEV
jgi:hypothetical protein